MHCWDSILIATYFIETATAEVMYLSIITGSDGVSFRLPHDFLSQQRLQRKLKSKLAMPLHKNNRI